MGDAGFGEVLKRAKTLPPKATLLYDEYAMPAKAVDPATEQERLTLQKLIPFVTREPELNRVVAERQLKVQRLRNQYWPKPHYEDTFDEHQPLAYYATMLRIATIVRDGHEPRLPKVKLTWKWNRAKLQDEYQKTPKATLTHEATYYINGVQVGGGQAGFLAAVEQIKSCKAGDVIQISPACIRTKGPFRYALFAPGHRIFETTGTEPFRGLVDLLADVVDRQRLRVELIPDEGAADLSLRPLDEEPLK
jgi:hypothetical protein